MPLSDLLLYLLIVAAVVLFNHFSRQAAKRKQQGQAAQGATRAGGPPLADPGEHTWGRHPLPGVPVPATDATGYEWGRGPLPPVEWPPGRVGDESERPPAISLQRERSPREPAARAAAEIHPGARRLEARGLFATREDLRRAVIAMTVLGPCRAIEPPELEDPGRPLPR